MSTRAVNIHQGYPFDVYIGSAKAGEDGYFGNPIRLKHPCMICGISHYGNAEMIACYRSYLDRRLATDEEFVERVRALAGKRLGCNCHPKIGHSCHGDALAEAADRLAAEEESPQ